MCAASHERPRRLPPDRTGSCLLNLVRSGGSGRRAAYIVPSSVLPVAGSSVLLVPGGYLCGWVLMLPVRDRTSISFSETVRRSGLLCDCD